MTPGPRVMCAKCLDVIQSQSRNDFVVCSCGKIAIDGGSEYTRTLGYPGDFIWDIEESRSDGHS